MRRKRSLHKTTVRGSILLFFESKETGGREVISLSQGKLVTSHSTKDRSVPVGLIKVNRKGSSHSFCVYSSLQHVCLQRSVWG